MNKTLGFVVLFAFIFSSCASAPVINHSQKTSEQLRVSLFVYPQNGYTNTAVLTVKDNEFQIDLKASEPTDGSGAGAKKSSSGNKFLTFVLALGSVALAGYFIYDYMTNPDSVLKK